MDYSLKLHKFYFATRTSIQKCKGRCFHIIYYIYVYLLIFFLMNNDQILDEPSEKLSVDISALVRSQSFFTDVKAVNTLLGPVKSVVKSLEFKITTLADCFVELIKLSQRINSLSPVSNYDFKYQCVEIFNKRWQEFDIQFYLLAYLLHSQYRGEYFLLRYRIVNLKKFLMIHFNINLEKGLQSTVLRDVFIMAMKI